MGVGDRERALGAILFEIGYRASAWPVPRIPGLPEEQTAWIMVLYRQLGGIQHRPRLAPRGWDHPMGGLIVELDEEQHFNRYRALTLSTEWARSLPWAADYLALMDHAETIALRRTASAGFWTGPGAEAIFGPSGPARQLHGAGSARWKQRALYDAIRDAAAAAGLVNLARVSVHDTVNGRALGQVLQDPHPGDVRGVKTLIDQRTLSHAEQPPFVAATVQPASDQGLNQPYKDPA